MGKQFFVENRPGAGGTSAGTFLAKQPPDGYTLAITGATHLISSHLYKNLQYDAFKDFTHISMMASGPYVLVVNPKKTPVNNVRELIAAAKAKPGAIDFASSGNGSSQHLVAGPLQRHGGREAQPCAVQGQRARDAGPARRRGRRLLRRRAERPRQRARRAPQGARGDHAEALGRAARTCRRWPSGRAPATRPRSGSASPAPPAYRRRSCQRLSAEIAKALKDPDLQTKFREAGVEADAMQGEELLRYMRAEDEKWGKVVRETGATVN
jgi:tripartite-type tricarboxylate transporter receptor subunit TctC